jgi:hypothetical protein
MRTSWYRGACAAMGLLLSACGASSGAGGSPGAADGGAPGISGAPASGGEGGGAAGTGVAGAPSSGGAEAGGSGGLASCEPMPSCDAPLPAFTTRPWKSIENMLTAVQNDPAHRGRDLVLTPNDAQWALGKFAYGLPESAIEGEEVDVWLNRDCGSSWELLGTAVTTAPGDHPTVEGVDDDGGRIYFQIPESQKLGIGRHRLRLVVAADGTGADQIIEVMPAGTQYFIADVDGTLTTSETEEYASYALGTVSQVNPDADKALALLAQHGYRPFYLTARPEFLVERTREFIAQRGLPFGVVHTTLLALGATGPAAVTFKQAELDVIHGRGFSTPYAFGNTNTDAEAYFLCGVQPDDHRIFFQYTDGAHGGRRIEAYGELLGDFSALPPGCQ